MTYRILCTLIGLFPVLNPATLPAQLKKVRLAAPTLATTELPFKIAQLQGFYREQGLDIEIVVIRGALGVTALIAGWPEKLRRKNRAFTD